MLSHHRKLGGEKFLRAGLYRLFFSHVSAGQPR